MNIINSVYATVFCVLLGELPRIDSMKEFLKYMRKSREKFAMQQRSSKTTEKASLVKLMATSVVDFLTEGMKSFCTSPCQDEMPNKDNEHSTQTCASPPTVVAAMGNQQLRGQVSVCVVVFVVTDVHSVHNIIVNIVYVHLSSCVLKKELRENVSKNHGHSPKKLIWSYVSY